MSVTAVLFGALLAIELPLAVAALSKRSRASRTARIVLFVVPLALALAVRVVRAFHSHQVLDWDETYYMSLAATAAAGRGLYPFIYGFAPMHIMGGIGYAAYSYVAAVMAFGHTIFALRAVSLLASAAGLAGVWILVRMWYGSATAWIAVPLTASLELFALSNTARMDAWTFAYVTWALVAVAVAFERWPERRWHVLAGLIFALGLQVHIDVAVTGAACGLLYFVRYVRDARTSRRPWLGHPMFLFASGLLAGGLIYLCANVLPDPSSYYTMTVRVRVDATTSYSSGAANVAGSFLAPRILAAKEISRYRQLTAICPWFEIALFVAAITAAAVRRNRADQIVLLLIPAVWAGAAILLNNASPLYYIHVLPVLVVPLAPLFTHGLRGQSNVTIREMGAGGLLAALIVTCGICASTAGRTIKAMRAEAIPTIPAIVEPVRQVVPRHCTVAGDGRLYVPYFADYPFFISLRPTEVKLGMLYHRETDEATYWRIEQPEAVFASGALPPALAEYVADRPLSMVAPGIWMDSARCRP